MSRVIDFEEYKERAKSRRQHTIVYANKLPVINDSDMVLNSLFITKAAADDEPIVVRPPARTHNYVQPRRTAYVS